MTAPPGFVPDAPPGFVPDAAPTTQESTLGKVGRIAKEELGKVPGRIAEDVKGIASGITDPKMSTVLPLTLGPGAGVVSRVGSVAMGRMLDEPKGTAGENLATAGKAIGTAGLWEAALGIGPKLGLSKLGVPSLESLAKRVGAFRYATEAPLAAYNAIKDRVPKGKWMFVPTINPKAPITALEAAEGLAKLERLDYEAARKEIVQELNRLDMRRAGLPQLKAKGPRPYAGSGFETRTSPERFAPSDVSKRGAAVAEALKSPLSRIAADVGATEEVEGVPVGALPFLMGSESLKSMAHKWLTPK